MKTQDRQSLVARPFYGTNTQGLRRLRFPFFISQCQRAGRREAKAPLPNPRWKQIPHPESTTVEASLEKTRASSASVRKDRAVACNPAGDANNPARTVDLRLGFAIVKGGQRGAPHKSMAVIFLRLCDIEATFLPDCVATLRLLTAR
jgi:hypothetical protein